MTMASLRLPTAAQLGVLFRFGVSGVVATVTTIALLWLFTEVFGVWYVASATAAWVISLLVSFTLQRTWTFRTRGRERAGGQLAAFVVLGLFNAAANAVLLYALVDWAGLPYLPAEVGLVLLIAAWNFLAMRYLIFRTPSGRTD